MNQTRADDEDTLHMLDLHTEGLNVQEIAHVIGVTPRTVRRRLKNVVEQDMLHDPDASTFWQNPDKET